MPHPLQIYVAGPYSSQSQLAVHENVVRAIDAGITLIEKGHYPFIPHLTHFVKIRAEEIDKPISYNEFLEWDRQFIDACDGFLYLDSSPGADKELAYAEKRDLYIFYSMDDVPDVAYNSS